MANKLGPSPEEVTGAGTPMIIEPEVTNDKAREALQAAPTPHEALARPHDYEKWYNGAREKALNG